MNCPDIETLLDDHAQSAMTRVERAALSDHLATCEGCRSAWRASRVLGSYAELVAPRPTANLFNKATAISARSEKTGIEKRSFWLGSTVGGALAASVAAAVLVLDPAAPAGDGSHSVPAVTMSVNQTRDVSLAIGSEAKITAARIRVVLAGGIGLDNFAGRNTIEWSTDLDPGMNRLTLPIVAIDSSGGELIVEVAHGSRRQVFVVHVNVENAEIVKLREPMTPSRV